MSEIENYVAPDDLIKAVETLARGGVTILAGGTDLTPQINDGKRAYAPTLMNIQHVAELSGISLDGEEIRIGALVTVTQIRQNELLPEILRDTADHFASEQIRNAATIGGNICNASPAGDMINPLLVLGASVELACWKEGRLEIRRVALNDLFTGPGRTKISENELLTAVTFANPSGDFIGRFRKSGPRPALEISTVTVGIGGDYKDGVLSNMRVAMGSVGPTPLRARKTEAALEGKKLNAATIADAVEAASQDASPIDDIRATQWYRSHLVQVFTEEILQNVCQS